MSVNLTTDVDSGEIFRNLMRHTTVGTTGETKSEIRALIADWLGEDPVKVSGFSDHYWPLLHINLQAALDEFMAKPGRECKAIGVRTPTTGGAEEIPFSKLFSPPTFKWGGASVGLVDYSLRACGVDEFMRCMERAIILFRDEEGPGVLWVHRTWRTIDLEVLTLPEERATRIIDELREASERLSPFKEKIFRIVLDGGPVVMFEKRPEPMTADDVILPEGVLPRINQHTISVSRRREKLKRMGMHLKRGILMHGPPGTGKTHTIRYLASRMPESSMLILPKNALDYAHIFLEILEPAIIVLDDIDLVAENRSLPSMSDRKRLFQVLEALDGINDTRDVLFVLTTNRADTMEPAIASRPGRIDQTIEIPRPDDDCRERLFELYSKDVNLQVEPSDIQTVLDRTKGVTASFFKELLRRATVRAFMEGAEKDADGRVAVSADVLFRCLDKMLDPNNPLTRQLLGADPEFQRPAGVVLQEV